MKITENSTIEEILDHPEGERVLAEWNVPCLGCPMMAMEMKDLKIGEVAEKYDIDLEAMLKELNEKD